MTSREIIIKLVDSKVISGEEAFTLINDICKQEMYDVWKTLESSKTSESSKTNISPHLTWTYDPNIYTVTALSGSSGPSITNPV